MYRPKPYNVYSVKNLTFSKFCEFVLGSLGVVALFVGLYAFTIILAALVGAL